MSFLSRFVSRAAALTKAHTHDLAVERDLAVPMPDGVVLLADRHFPRRGGDKLPLVLMRTPYGRRSFGVFAQIFAERGYQVLVQSARGTFGSGGGFRAFMDEGRDGRATLDWLATQDWFGGKLGMFGPSYLEYTHKSPTRRCFMTLTTRQESTFRYCSKAEPRIRPTCLR